MLSNWFEHSERSPNPLKFNVMDISEKDNRDLDKVNEIFKKIFLDNTMDYDLIEKISKKIGWNETFAKFISPRLTKQKNMKKGKFGEMLEGTILEEFFDFVIPIKKWRYAITSDQSLPSTDIVAIKNDESKITEMSFVESKVTGTDNKKLVTEAYEQLMNDQAKGFPQILSFIISRLVENKDSLSERFIDYYLERETERLEKIFNELFEPLDNLASVKLTSISYHTFDFVNVKDKLLKIENEELNSQTEISIFEKIDHELDIKLQQE